jgi:DNA-directed RNA polymerase subunit M/transcription elongation factor TFIIS
MEKFCIRCKKVFVKRQNEKPSRFEKRKFCSIECGRAGNSKEKSDRLKKRWEENRENFPKGFEHSKSVGRGTTGKFKKNASSLKELSSRTVSKIIARLLTEQKNFGCSSCGWREAIGDIHHIVPQKEGGTDEHNNLTYLCPNCHRLLHNGKEINFLTIEKQLGDLWEKYYYG